MNQQLFRYLCDKRMISKRVTQCKDLIRRGVAVSQTCTLQLLR